MLNNVKIAQKQKYKVENKRFRKHIFRARSSFANVIGKPLLITKI
jgi:hypothetical protein